MHRVVPLLVLALVGGCGMFTKTPPTPPPDVDSRLAAFIAVCTGTGTSLALDRARHDDHRAVVVEGKGDDVQIRTDRLPKDWTFELPYAEGIDDVDVVVCGERVAAKAVRLCDGIGGQKDAIKWHTATYSYTARAARTGKPLGKPKTIRASSHRCPTNISVSPEHVPLDQYALISKSALERFTKPYLED